MVQKIDSTEGELMPFFHYGKAKHGLADMRMDRFSKEIKCGNCEFIARTLRELKDHKKEVHAY